MSELAAAMGINVWPWIGAAALLLIAFLVIGRRGGWPAVVVMVVLSSPPASPPVAVWAGGGRAVITWSSPAFSCLEIRHASGEHAMYHCYDAGRHVVVLGGEQTDAQYRPAAADVYCATGLGCAVLTGQPVYLPVISR